MIHPIGLNYEHNDTVHLPKGKEPVLSFITVLQEAIDEKFDYDSMKNFELNKDRKENNFNSQIEHNSEHAVVQSEVKDTKIATDNNNFVRFYRNEREGKEEINFTTRNEGILGKVEVNKFQGVISQPNVMGATVTDKNTNTVKQHSSKKDNHSNRFTGRITVASQKENTTIEAGKNILSSKGLATLEDTLHHLKSMLNDASVRKGSKVSDLKQLITNLTTLKTISQKDVHNALSSQAAVFTQELSGTKTRKTPAKSHEGIAQLNSEAKQKEAKNTTVLFNAVRLNTQADESPKVDKKTHQTTERNDSHVIQTNVKQNELIKMPEIKPLMHEELMQLLNKAKILQDGEKTTLSLKLYPESLGKLMVSLGLEQGVLSGRFIVESEAAKELLMQQLETIRMELEQNGVQVGDFEVNVKHQRQREFTEQMGLQIQQNTEYETASNRYMYHDGLLDVII